MRNLKIFLLIYKTIILPMQFVYPFLQLGPKMDMGHQAAHSTPISQHIRMAQVRDTFKVLHLD